MFDLSFVQESVTESEENVRESLDMIYIKNQMMMEYVLNNPDAELSDDVLCYLESAASIGGSSKELSVYSFDNKHILKAIRYFNKAYSEFDFSDSDYVGYKATLDRGTRTDLKTYKANRVYPPAMLARIKSQIINPSGYFVKALYELEEQFDCRLSINIIRGGTGTYLMRFPQVDKISRITISKTKGFQLDKLPIEIALDIKQILDVVPNNKKLFGADFTGILLHEIYHNIVHCLDLRNRNLHADIKRTFKSADNEHDNRYFIMSKMEDLIDRFKYAFGINNDQINDTRTKNRLYVLSQINNNPNAMRRFEQDIKNNMDHTNDESELDQYIADLQALKSFISIGKGVLLVSTVCTILMAGLGFIFGITVCAVVGTVGLACMALAMLAKAVRSLFSVSVGVKEEYFCDLFAAMYKLPIHMRSYKRQIELNKRFPNKVSKIRGLSNDITKSIKDVHPEEFQRELVSYRVAKQLLDSGQKLKPEIKRYLKYIVNLHEGIEDIDVPYSNHEAKKLDPEAAKDLQKTLDDFVKQTGVPVTESVVEEEGE